MNLKAPVSEYMVTDLTTVKPDTDLSQVEAIFNAHDFHHLPVVVEEEIVGMLTKGDLQFFLRGYSHGEKDRFIREARLRSFKAADIMVKEVETLAPGDSLQKALDILLEGRFRALPVAEKGKLLGLITNFDFLRFISQMQAQEVLR